LLRSLALAISDRSLRSLGCAPEAAVFVESDETTLDMASACHNAFRRLLLQIGGANIAGADRAVEPAYFVVVRGRKSCPLTPYYSLLAPLAEAGAR
jgi:hypothetical protein